MKVFKMALVIVCVLLTSHLRAAWAEEAGDDYIIRPPDVLEISVYGEPELSRQLVVRPDGRVSFPLIGDIRVAGRSTRQVKELVDQKLNAFVPEASSTVIVRDLGSLMYFVIGQVAKPGVFNVSTPLTVLQALSLAGGMTTFADTDDILIIRGHGEATQRLRFDYSEVRKGKKLEDNILLERGDVVLVP